MAHYDIQLPVAIVAEYLFVYTNLIDEIHTSAQKMTELELRATDNKEYQARRCNGGQNRLQTECYR